MTAPLTIEGSCVALVTPFLDGSIDEESLRALVRWHLVEGTSAIVPCGTTGESATLTHEEHHKVIRIVQEEADGQCQVLAGTGSNSTAEAIALTQAAENLGATASLQITPYYNKPSQEGLYQHFKAIAEATELPILLYNVPGRTAVNMSPQTVARLAEIENIVGIKEASADLTQVELIAKLCGPDFIILSGEDGQNDEIMERGATGVISVTANIVPRQMSDFCRLMNKERVTEGKALHKELMPLHDVLFVETNPIPVKAAVAMMGKCREEYRLPLCPPSDEHRDVIATVLKNFNLIET